MGQRAVRKKGQYRAYKIEGYKNMYEIYYGTKETGVHVENICYLENFEWAVAEINRSFQQAMKEEFGSGVSN